MYGPADLTPKELATALEYERANATHLFALIKKTSKYYATQHTDGIYFPVQFVNYDTRDVYVVFGNDNRYRMADLNFFVKIGDRLVRLK